jgi:hypothetical protein
MGLSMNREQKRLNSTGKIDMSQGEEIGGAEEVENPFR